MKGNKPLVVFLVILVVLSGFGREYIMKNINWIIKTLTQGGANYAQSEFNFLLDWSLSSLSILKWGLTIFFTLYFFCLTFLIIKNVFIEQSKVHKSVIVLYTILVLLSAIVYVIGWATGLLKDFYHVTRALMGIAQSFIPLMLIYLVFKFIDKKNDYSAE